MTMAEQDTRCESASTITSKLTVPVSCHACVTGVPAPPPSQECTALSVHDGGVDPCVYVPALTKAEAVCAQAARQGGSEAACTGADSQLACQRDVQQYMSRSRSLSCLGI